MSGVCFTANLGLGFRAKMCLGFRLSQLKLLWKFHESAPLVGNLHIKKRRFECTQKASTPNR